MTKNEKMAVRGKERWANLTPEAKAALIAKLVAGRKRARLLRAKAAWRRRAGLVKGIRKTRWAGLKTKGKKTTKATKPARRTPRRPNRPTHPVVAAVEQQAQIDRQDPRYKVISVVNDPNTGQAVLDGATMNERDLLNALADLLHGGNVWYEFRIEREDA